jgi:hypothetical protein
MWRKFPPTITWGHAIPWWQRTYFTWEPNLWNYKISIYAYPPSDVQQKALSEFELATPVPARTTWQLWSAPCSKPLNSRVLSSAAVREQPLATSISSSRQKHWWRSETDCRLIPQVKSTLHANVYDKAEICSLRFIRQYYSACFVAGGFLDKTASFTFQRDPNTPIIM